MDLYRKVTSMRKKEYELHYGFTRLDAVMADDLSVVNSARVSFGRRVTEIDEADKGLINFLMRERHGTPFEHNSFRFHIKCPLFVAREWFRHRIGSFNEFSARYSEFRGEYYAPKREAVRRQVGKPGAYSFETIEDDEVAQFVIDDIYKSNMLADSAYQSLLRRGVAKELARSVLPVTMYTEFYWTVNARALMNFLSLRTDANAQLEIREYAQEIEDAFAAQMPLTYAAWNNNGRTAP